MLKNKSLDLQQEERRGVFDAAMAAIREGENTEEAQEQLFEYFELAQKQATDQVSAMIKMQDNDIIRARGGRVQTTEEREYFQKVIDVLQEGDPREITGIGVTIPTTIIDTVFENLAQEYPILNYVDMMFVKENIRLVYNKLGPQTASWGALCATISKEITPALGAIEAGKYALSAYIYLCKDMLKLGPEWLDRYVRVILTDALAAGLENGIINGNGLNQPIGMLYDLEAYKADGTLQKKTAAELKSFSIEALGAVLDTLKTDVAGRRRRIGVPFLAYSILDEAQVLSARKVLGPYGYIDVVPYELEFVPVASLATGEAVLGIRNQYLVTVAGNPDGELEYSDEYKFLEKNRTYTINLLANGIPKDDNAFVRLDVSDLAPFLPLGDGGFGPDHVYKVAIQQGEDDALVIEGAVTVANVEDGALDVVVGNTDENPIPTTVVTDTEGA